MLRNVVRYTRHFIVEKVLNTADEEDSEDEGKILVREQQN